MKEESGKPLYKKVSNGGRHAMKKVGRLRGGKPLTSWKGGERTRTSKKNPEGIKEMGRSEEQANVTP